MVRYISFSRFMVIMSTNSDYRRRVERDRPVNWEKIKEKNPGVSEVFLSFEKKGSEENREGYYEDKI